MKKTQKQILSFNSLRIGYISGKRKKIILPPLDASALQGELIAVIGRNGIGKSTLLRTLIGLQDPMGGDILLYDRDIKTISRKKLARLIGYISTEVVKVDKMTVYDLVALGRFPHTNWIGKIDDKNHRLILEALNKTGIEKMSNSFVTELSDGERQRVMIARLIAQDSGILVMDEPTAFLDIGNKYEILHLMRSLARENNKTIIFSTHDLHLAVNQADKIWLMLEKELMEGAPEDLMIRGAFDHLFDPLPMQFDPEHGVFTIRHESSIKIYLEGSGQLKYWTEKALKRIGYLVSTTKTDKYIIVPANTNENWQIVSDGIIVEYCSLYELLMDLQIT